MAVNTIRLIANMALDLGASMEPFLKRGLEKMAVRLLSRDSGKEIWQEASWLLLCLCPEGSSVEPLILALERTEDDEIGTLTALLERLCMLPRQPGSSVPARLKRHWARAVREAAEQAGAQES